MLNPRQAVLFCGVSLIAFLVAAAPAEEPTTSSHVYKTTPQGKLELVIHLPPGAKPTDRRPAIVFFFGGGWQNGTIEQFGPQADYLARRGMVAARADYRVKSRQAVTPKECVADAKSAVRWLRSHAGELGIDPDRIVAAGGSAGGHLAACTSLTPGLDEADEDAGVSSRPNALVLFNPALRFAGVPRLMERIDGDEALGQLISPTLHVSSAMPPTIIFFGTADPLIEQGQEFVERARQQKVHVELFTAEGAKHGFFNRSPWLEQTTRRMDEFLTSLGYLVGEPTLKEGELLRASRAAREGTAR